MIANRVATNLLYPRGDRLERFLLDLPRHMRTN